MSRSSRLRKASYLVGAVLFALTGLPLATFALLILLGGLLKDGVGAVGDTDFVLFVALLIASIALVRFTCELWGKYRAG